MLRHLFIKDLAVISEVGIDFGSGLNVLSGETGAGKSIVVDSLALLSGVRASSELIRAGAERLSVVGVFEPQGSAWCQVLAAAGFEVESGELVIRREIERQGRNQVFLNDQPVTLALLSRVAPHLIRIHTQREELGLISAEQQRSWLDRSAGAVGEVPLSEVAAAYEEYTALAQRLDRVQGDQKLRHERIDLLEFQRREIDAAGIVAGEEEGLRQEREILRHSEAIAQALGISYNLLSEEEGSAIERISRAERELLEVAEWEREAVGWTRDLATAALTLAEMVRGVRDRLDAVGSDPARLDAIEERLAALDRLFRKYGSTTEEVVQYQSSIEQELEELQLDEDQRQELTEQVDKALGSYRDSARKLTRFRRSWAKKLATEVHAELRDLALGKARFEARLGTRRRENSPLTLGGRPVELSAAGVDHVEYLLAANPGEAAAALARSASGGELSRIYLAVQLASRLDGPAATSSLVFDEVDAGIGGAEAAALGRKLQRLARGGQILAVTHLPQVASHADHHFRVHKKILKGRTRTRIDVLEDKARVDEVARMLAGEKVTELSRSHAAELISSAGREAR